MTDNESGGFSPNRRQMLRGMTGGTVAAALAGCTDLLQNEEVQDVEEAEIPDEPIQVGAQIALEGGVYVLTEQQEVAMEIAVDRINDAGGIAGREVEVEWLDEMEGAVSNHERFVEDGKDVIIGPGTSGAATSVAPIADEQETITIIPDGGAFSLFEETLTDPTYVFRMQNPDIMETVVAARDVVDELGAENINTIAGVNPDYEFGRTQWEGWSTAIQQLTGAEIVYEGFPDLGTDDYSTHVTEVENESPDVIFTSMWGADASLFISQAAAAGMWEEVDVHSSTIFYGGAQEFSREDVEQAAKTLMVGRNYVYNYPPPEQYSPVGDLHDELVDRGVSAVYGYVMSTYGAMTMYATAAEKAVRVLGRWPTDEELIEIMSNHGFWLPSTFAATDQNYFNGRQVFTTLFSGELTWDEEFDMAGWTDTREYNPVGNHAPPGMDSIEWIESW